jgi:hypothetical protein
MLFTTIAHLLRQPVFRRPPVERAGLIIRWSHPRARGRARFYRRPTAEVMDELFGRAGLLVTLPYEIDAYPRRELMIFRGAVCVRF